MIGCHILDFWLVQIFDVKPEIFATPRGECVCWKIESSEGAQAIRNVTDKADVVQGDRSIS